MGILNMALHDDAVAAPAHETRRSGVSGVIGAIRGYFDYRRTIVELDALNDRELADIGLTRGDIHNVAAKASAARHKR